MIAYEYESLFGDSGPKDNSGDPFGIEFQDNLKWISMIDRLAGGDITKHAAIYETNYIECLNLLSFWWYRDKYDQQLRKRQELQNNMRR